MEQVTTTRENGSSRFKLTVRDKAILRHIGQFGFSSAEWIRGQFSKTKTNKNHYRRLSQLRRKGYLEDLVGDRGRKLGYRLTKKGLDEVRGGRENILGDTSYRATYQTNFAHDNYLAGLGTVFQSFPGVVEYRSEQNVRVLLAKKYNCEEKKTGGYKVPDALFRIQTKDRCLRVALELEIAQKATAYYRRVLRQLVISRDFDLVFFISPDSKTLTRLQSNLAWVRSNDPIVRSAKRHNGFYFSELSDVLKNEGNAKFTGEGLTFTLAQLAS